MKSRGLAWIVDVCRGNKIGGVAIGYGYLTLILSEVLLGGNVDSRHPALEVIVRAALGAALPPVSKAFLSWTDATARAIAAVTGEMANLLTVKAFENTVTLILSETCAAA